MAKRTTAARNGSTLQYKLQQLGATYINNGSSKERPSRVEVSVNTHIVTQIDDIGIDSFARKVLEMTMPEWVPMGLQKEMEESLRGYSEWAALWIAECLTDCCQGNALATTGIKHIDNMLWVLYSKILNCAREHGVKIANHY